LFKANSAIFPIRYGIRPLAGFKRKLQNIAMTTVDTTTGR
jgi:hypothetical protein